MFCVYFIVHAFGYKRRGFAVINIDNISYWVVKNMILRFRPCWAYPVGWSNCWVYPVGWSIYGGRVEIEEGQEGSIEHVRNHANRETMEVGARDDQLVMTQ